MCLWPFVVVKLAGVAWDAGCEFREQRLLGGEWCAGVRGKHPCGRGAVLEWGAW